MFLVPLVALFSVIAPSKKNQFFIGLSIFITQDTFLTKVKNQLLN
jgi:hypothetical protein